MSKIYEALLRAELDRAAANGKQPPMPSSDQISAEAILASLGQSYAPVAEETVAESIYGGVTASKEVHAALNAVTPALDPKRIKVNVWHPSYEQLPALLERGAEVEQFRSLRSRMQEFRDLNKLQTVMISSGLPQEGKSFIAMNLAVAFARHKASRVLLIDGDMRRSSLHKMLGSPNDEGLTEYLGGQSTMYDVMQYGKGEDGRHLHPGLASLTFIAGGADAKNAADLSGNSRFRELIEAASPIFDWIVVDTPPVNLVADGVNLARSCDGVLLIARGGVTKYEVAQRALSELKAAKVLGFVLNAVSKPPVTGGYYGYDGYDAPPEKPVVKRD